MDQEKDPMTPRPNTRSNTKRIFLGSVSHRCGENAVVKIACNGVPCPSTKVFNEKGKAVGIIEEVLGRSEEAYASFSGAGVPGEKFFIDSMRVLRHEKFLSRTECVLKKEREDRNTTTRKKGGYHEKRDLGRSFKQDF